MYLIKVSHDITSIESNFIDEEINRIGLNNNGEYLNYDVETELNKQTSIINPTSVIYEWKFTDLDSISNFIGELPLTYKIIFVKSLIVKVVNESYNIYVSSSKPEITKFNDQDKILYRSILSRYLKSITN